MQSTRSEILGEGRNTNIISATIPTAQDEQINRILVHGVETDTYLDSKNIIQRILEMRERVKRTSL